MKLICEEVACEKKACDPMKIFLKAVTEVNDLSKAFTVCGDCQKSKEVDSEENETYALLLEKYIELYDKSC